MLNDLKKIRDSIHLAEAGAMAQGGLHSKTGPLYDVLAYWLRDAAIDLEICVRKIENEGRSGGDDGPDEGNPSRDGS